MTIRTAMANMLEGMAVRLRGADSTSAQVLAPVPANDTATARPVKRRLDPVNRLPHPAGFWLCTVSTFDDFLVGHAYLAIREGSSVRVYPYSSSSWAPYWQTDEGRFCYPDHQLDFTYLGATLPAGREVDERTRQQRIDKRIADRAA